MKKFKNSVLSERLNATLQFFRDSVVCDYQINHLGGAYYLRIVSFDIVPAILITSLVQLGFTFNSVSILSNEINKLVSLFYIDEKDI